MIMIVCCLNLILSLGRFFFCAEKSVTKFIGVVEDKKWFGIHTHGETYTMILLITNTTCIIGTAILNTQVRLQKNLTIRT
jgi:hypothetical protein